MSPYEALTNPIWERFRDTQAGTAASSPFAGVMAWAGNGFGFSLSPGGETRPARGLFVSGDFFRVLGVQPVLGRVFSAADDRRGCGLPGAVVSYKFWQRELAGDAAVVGRRLTLNDHAVEIIGVTPAGFSGVEVGQVYDVAVPICSQAVLWSDGNVLDVGTTWWLTVMARLQPGWTLQHANAQLRVSSAGLFQATLPSNYPAKNVKDYLKFKLRAVPAKTGVSQLRTEYSDPLLLLLATTGLVLLIACSNLANLTLARATAREREIAVRLAIGASRGRLVRQLMAESVLLALAGGACGLLLAGELGRLMLALLRTPGSSLFLDLEPDAGVFAFAAGIAGLTCILFGLTADAGSVPGGAFNGAAGQRPAVLRHPAQTARRRCRLPSKRNPGRRSGFPALEDSRDRAHRLQTGYAAADSGAARHHLRRRGLHAATERRQLE
jgi:predicted permease